MMSYKPIALVQDCGNSNVLAVELPQSCTKSSEYAIAKVNSKQNAHSWLNKILFSDLS